MRIVIIGGSDAGISAALRVRELNSSAEISVLLADPYPNYSVCGLPFYISGEVEDWRRLAHRTSFDGIQILTDCIAEKVNTGKKEIIAKHNGNPVSLRYDKLLIATGALPAQTDIKGLGLAGVISLRVMNDALAMHDYISTRKPTAALIVGGGYIGVELADALTRRGMRVTVVTSSARLLSTVDVEMGALVERELEHHGVTCVGTTSVDRIEQSGSALRCFGTNAFQQDADLVVIGAGVHPNTALARDAGIQLGLRDAIRVDRHMRTNVADVYAAGDCVETWHSLLDRPAYLPLGTTAHRQGRVAGENMAGGERRFGGSLGTQVVKVFDLAVGRTGLLEREAREAGFNPRTCEVLSWDHNRYYPGAEQFTIRLTADEGTQQILGAQMVGHWRTQISKRIDVVSAALLNHMTVDQLDDLDLSYTPPLGTPWDAIQAAAHEWQQVPQ